MRAHALVLLLACVRDEPTASARAVERVSLSVASDTVKEYQRRDSLHRIAQKRDLDSLARDKSMPAYSSRALARLRAREDSLGLAVVVVDTVAPPPPPPPPASSCPSVTDWTARPTSAMAKPGYLQTATDPDFGTRLTRVTGDPGTAIGNGVGGTWGNTFYHNYPKDPVWSADQALMVLKATAGISGGNYLFLDGSTYQVLFNRWAPGPEARWHPTLPDVMVYVTPNGSIGHWNVRTDVRTTTYAPPAGAYSGAGFGTSEGNLSRDGSLIAVNATRASDGHLVAYVVNVNAGTKGAEIDLTAAGVTNLDWAGISASGNYVVVHGVIAGTTSATKVLSATTGALVSSWPEFSRPTHYDLFMDAGGVEWGAGPVGGGTDQKKWIARKLVDGSVVALTPTLTYNGHTSARATGRPGWVYAVVNDFTGSVLDGEMFAVALDGSQQIERYGRYHGINNVYDAEPHPTPSPDGRRIVFASNWGSTAGPIQAYVVSCPP